MVTMGGVLILANLKKGRQQAFWAWFPAAFLRHRKGEVCLDGIDVWLVVMAAQGEKETVALHPLARQYAQICKGNQSALLL